MTPRMPYDGRRGEQSIAVIDTHVLWRIGGVPTARQLWWIVTDYEGRIVGPSYKTKSLALAVFNALPRATE